MKRADLSKIKRNRFGYEEILEQMPGLTYEELYDVLEELCEKQMIVPVKKSGKTSFLPQVYREYKKLAAKPDHSHLIPEIRSLHPSLSIDRYLSNPGEFEESREYILKLSSMLWQKDARLEQWMSVKEKSYAIWGDEKFLESRQGRSILAFHHLDGEKLHYYYAPEPFFCRVFQPEGKGDVLILENKDTWYSIGRAIKGSDTGQIAGLTVGLLVYGEGNKITREQEGMSAFLEEMGYGNAGQKVCYAGDIDRAGLGMFYDAKRQNPDLAIEPCLPLYHAMVRRALQSGQKPELSEDKRAIGWERGFLSYFTEPGRSLVWQVLEENRRIPQEILNYQDYMRMCRGQSC